MTAVQLPLCRRRALRWRIRAAGSLLRAAALTVFAGCEANHYELTMSVEGDTLHRRLVCWGQQGQDDDGQPRYTPLDQAELDRMAAAYGVDPPATTGQKFEFSGEFRGATPDDVGGAGSLTVWTTDMGATTIYVERFRGVDELTETLEPQLKAADELVAVLTDWLKSELGAGAEFDRVREFLDGPGRQDLKSLAAYAWVGTAVQDVSQSNETGVELLVRVAQYAAERGYLRPTDLPELLQIVGQSDNERLLAFVRRMVASRLGEGISPDEWDFLADSGSLAASLNQSLQNHPRYREFLQERRERGNMDEEPLPTEFVMELAYRVVELRLLAFDGLQVTLECPTPPYHTNGTWSDESSDVSWKRNLTPHGMPAQEVLPPLLYAMWAEPNDEFQTEHFGRVVLQGEPLSQYCLWREALAPAEAGEWDAFLLGLRPGSELVARLEGFRFASDPPESAADGQSLAERPRGLILSALNEAE